MDKNNIIIFEPRCIGTFKNEYISELTKAMDECLIEPYKEAHNSDYGDVMSTYIMYEPNIDDKYFSFRFPGATRGCMILENDIITGFSFIQSTCFDKKCVGCYEENKLIETCNRFIGRKVSFKKK